MSDQVVQVKTATYNITAITGNLTFTYSESGATVSNRADAEIYQTGKKLVTVDVSGTLAGIDQEGYAAITLGDSQTLTIVGKQVSDDSDVTITISNVMFTGNDGTVNHSSEGGATLNWEAYSADGTTSPIAFT
jgi:hypothetical protein